MCGICGAAWTDPRAALDDARLAAMMDRLAHRGPDDAGVYRDDHAALGFRRLSIVDLAGGHQPLSNEDGTVWTVFNGEIYNFPALRHRLEATGHTLRSTGDTEVLVHLYEDEGTGMFALLRGHVRAGDLGRAPAHAGPGPRPAGAEAAGLPRTTARGSTFASELKALLALPEHDFPRRVDPLAARPVPDLRLRPPPAARSSRACTSCPRPITPSGTTGRSTLDRYWNPDWNVERRPADRGGRRASSAPPWPTRSASR